MILVLNFTGGRPGTCYLKNGCPNELEILWATKDIFESLRNEKSCLQKLVQKSTTFRITLRKISADSPIIAHLKNISFVWVAKPDFREGQVEK